jgi:hypothetical protein
MAARIAERNRHAAPRQLKEVGAALALQRRAGELPTYQRVELGILADRSVDAREQPTPFELLAKKCRGACCTIFASIASASVF